MNEDKDCAKCVCVDNSERQDHSSDHAYQMTGKKNWSPKEKRKSGERKPGKTASPF